MRPLNREEILEATNALEAAGLVEVDERPYPGWAKLLIWGGLTSFSWGVVLAVIFTVWINL